MKKIGFIVYEGFAIWQVSLMQMFLKQDGWEINTLSVDGGLVATDGGIYVDSEILDNKDPKEYDLILLAGGEINESLLDKQTLIDFLQEYDGIIAASCASSMILGSAGLLDCEYTTMPHIHAIYNEYYEDGTYVDTDLCVTDRIITSRGHAHYEFMMAVFEKVGFTKNDPKIEKLALKLSKGV
ncbi:ThiJ/PfpI domain-containing protein [Evansella cellulosilytica DSM 2522]|uniref:ThiJ/PfpI domain-containing protein n=2 Tax=Evansella TaxID=2837485 RepID=E6TR75_EVAC2|nr:ThiJ/PfpI domain-containing protein [Evansella cellulosilytica DSM 2522]